LAQIIVRNLEDAVKIGLRERALRHGKSMEEEVRDILRASVTQEGAPPVRLGTTIAARFAGAGLDEPIPEWRGGEAEPADLGS
jgi:plasmid stability protein